MSTFPSIRPSSRVWTFGNSPFSTFQSLSGYEVRVQHDDPMPNGRLILGFRNVSDNISNQLAGHYVSQSGGMWSFSLPAEVWAGADQGPWDYFTSAGRQIEWLYAEPTNVEWVRPGISTVTCSLRTVLV